VRHPNVVQILDYGTTPERHVPFVAMEYVAGQALDFFIRHDVLTLPQRVRLLAQLAEALAAVHQAGICHRDIKPANVLVTEELLPKLSDFGIARLPNSELTRSGQVMGSPAYMAPEAFISPRIDARADLFSFGIVAYEVLHGQRLFRGDTLLDLMHQITAPEPFPPERLHPDLSLPLAAILLRCLARRPEDRFASAQDLARALQDVLATL
jgi:serine/threonine-protein kinase